MGELRNELIHVTDEANLSIYLQTESDGNVRFYDRFGFKMPEHMNLRDITQLMWIMVREVKGEDSVDG
jgi:hypothetical protein